MSFWEQVKQFMAVEPMQVRTSDDAFEFTDLAAQIWALQGHRSQTWRIASIEESLGVPAILRAVSLIAATTGSLSMEAYQNGSLIADPQSVPRIIVRPNPFTTPYAFFRDTAYYHASRGEFWWWVAHRDVDGIADALYPVPPWEVTVQQNGQNRLRPLIQWQGRTIPNEDMVHQMYLPDRTGLRGVGPLQLCGAAASVAVESQAWAANFFSGKLPSAIGKTDQDLDEDDILALDAQWREKDGSNLPRWLGNGIDLKEFSVDPGRAQLTESREFQVGEAARMFGMPGPLLEYSAPGSSLTYQNNESVWREFQAGCLSPYYLEPIEQAMSDLLTRSTVARFNVNQLLRADAKTRWEIYAIAATVVGAQAADTIARQAEGLAPGNVDYAPVPQTPPSAIPTILPPDQTPRLRSVNPVRCSGKRFVRGILRPCNKLLAEAGPFTGTCPRCGTAVAA